MLSGNEITDVSPLKALRGLRWLALNNNRIGDIAPLMRLNHLRSLDLTENTISQFKPIQHHPAFQKYKLSNQRVQQEGDGRKCPHQRESIHSPLHR